MTETIEAPSKEATLPASPYKGLTHYTAADASFFFGREGEIEIIVANLMASRLTLLYGESGVGKSSVLRAGVERRLHEEAAQNLSERGEPEFLAVAFSEWRDDPVAALGEAIRAAAEKLYGKTQEPVPASARLDETIAAWTERIDGDVILILDQFEEYFLYHPADEGAGTFAVEFPRALNRADLRVSFLIGIREDALAKLDAFKGRIPNLFDNYLRIEHLNTKAARAAIEKPIAAYNRLRPEGSEEIAIEPELVDAVLSQVRTGQFTFGQAGKGAVDGGAGPVAGEDEIETPFLQLVMTRLWEEEMAGGSHTLRRETLDRLGGAERIVRTHLDHAMGTLPFEQQDVAADVFHHLVTPSGTKIAHALGDLAEYVEYDEDKLLPVLEKLSGGDVRILRPVAPPPGESGGLRYEIFHDVLAAAILDWRARWKQAETERELAANLEEQERERKEAQEQAALERRRARTFRGVAGIAVIVAGIAALLGIWAFRQKDTAQKQRLTARAAGLASESSNQLALEPRYSLALALSAMDVKPTARAEQALRVALAESRVRSLLRGHTNWVNTARFSPDGRYVLTAADDKTARIWDAKTGKTVKVLKGQGDLVNWGDWSADGNRIVTGGGKKALIWDAKTGKRLKELRVPDIVVTSSFGGPLGEWVATASFDDVLRVFNAKTGKLVWKKKVPDLHSARFDGPGTHIVTASQLPDYKARVFEWQNPRAKPVIINAPDPKTGKHVHTDAINAAAFSRDGSKVVTASDDKSIAVWDARTGDKVTQLYGPRDTVRGIAMSPNESFVAGASSDGAIYLWDWQAENRIAKIVGHTDIVSDVSFSPDGQTLASASGDRTARLWQVPPLVTLPHTQPVTWASWSPDGKLVATASNHCSEGFCYGHIWDARKATVLHDLAKHTDWLTGTAFSPDGKYVATSSDDQSARVWSVASGKQLKVLKGHDDWAESVDFHPDGRLLVTSSLDGTARIWNWRKGKTIATLHEPDDDTLHSAVFSPDGRYVLTTSGSPHDYSARIWDWQRSGKKAYRVLKGHTGAVSNATWSRDGRLVVTASSDRTARVWNWRTGKTLAVLRGQAGALKFASFNPFGSRVITTSADGTTRVWNWRSQKALTQSKWQIDLVHSGFFSPDGTKLLTSSDDWTAAIFRCETCGSIDRLVRVARERVRRTVRPTELAALLEEEKD